MTQTAGHWVDHVFAAVPVRQWVVSLPKRLRYFLVRDARLLNRVVRIALNEVERAIRALSPGAPCESGSGGVVFIHRFGSALNVHIHLHACLIDGLIGRTSEGLSFHPVRLDEVHITAVSEAIRRRVLRLFERLVWEPGQQRLRYQLPQPGPRGETVLRLTPLEFLNRIAQLIPPLPRADIAIAIAILACWRRIHPGAQRSRLARVSPSRLRHRPHRTAHRLSPPRRRQAPTRPLISEPCICGPCSWHASTRSFR